MAAKSPFSVDNEKYIDQQTQYLHGAIKFDLPGYRVTYATRYQNATKGHVMTYVNGRFMGAWMNSARAVPEQQFMRRRERPAYSPKDRALAIKVMGKRRALQQIPRLNEVSVMFDPCWPSWGPVLVHLRRLARAYPNLALVREE